MTRKLLPRDPVLKALFASSCNSCAMCDERLTDPQWPRVLARVCHIKGERPGSARYDESQTDEERRSFENLMLLCPNDHAKIDDTHAAEYPVERLIEIKTQHEDRCTQATESMRWRDDGARLNEVVAVFRRTDRTKHQYPKKWLRSGRPPHHALSRVVWVLRLGPP